MKCLMYERAQLGTGSGSTLIVRFKQYTFIVFDSFITDSLDLSVSVSTISDDLLHL